LGHFLQEQIHKEIQDVEMVYHIQVVLIKHLSLEHGQLLVLVLVQ
jgi:hypothetical protein